MFLNIFKKIKIFKKGKDKLYLFEFDLIVNDATAIGPLVFPVASTARQILTEVHKCVF